MPDERWASQPGWHPPACTCVACNNRRRENQLTSLPKPKPHEAPGPGHEWRQCQTCNTTRLDYRPVDKWSARRAANQVPPVFQAWVGTGGNRTRQASALRVRPGGAGQRPVDRELRSRAVHPVQVEHYRKGVRPSKLGGSLNDRTGHSVALGATLCLRNATARTAPRVRGSKVSSATRASNSSSASV